MRIQAIAPKELETAAKAAFQEYEIEISESDLFLKGRIAGQYQAPWYDHDFYISTEYVYEDRMVNGNQTRYKVAMPCVLLKKDRYEVVYDYQDRYYVAYLEQDKICFCPYHEMLERLNETTTLIKELIPV